MAIKVYNLWQLAKSGDKMDSYEPIQKQKLIRQVKLTDDFVEKFYSETWKTSGKYYEVNEEETERLFGVKKKTPKTITVDAPTKTQEQVKYDIRKKKMIDAGFVFDEQTTTFSKGDNVILASELINLHSAKFGKLLKS